MLKNIIRKTVMFSLALSGLVGFGEIVLHPQILPLNDEGFVGPPVLAEDGSALTYYYDQETGAQEICIAGRVKNSQGVIIRCDPAALHVTVDGQDVAQLGSLGEESAFSIERFSADDSLAVSLLVDARPSMTMVAAEIGEKLEDVLGSQSGKYSLIFYGNGYCEEQPLENNRDFAAVRRKIEKIKDRDIGDLPVNDVEALDLGLTRLRQHETDSRRAVIWVTDGQRFDERKSDIDALLKKTLRAKDQEIILFVLPIGFRGRIKSEFVDWLDTPAANRIFAVHQLSGPESFEKALAPDFRIRFRDPGQVLLPLDGKSHFISLKYLADEEQISLPSIEFMTAKKGDGGTLTMLIVGGMLILAMIGMGIIILMIAAYSNQKKAMSGLAEVMSAPSEAG
ncbi:MAG: vWA domain-containing protein [Lentisphaeria bacterium]|nr:vWA domain-containing protein [Lentisphaeria bacterium]